MGGGEGGGCESDFKGVGEFEWFRQKEKSVANPFFQIMLNEVRKMISGDVKTDVKQMEIKDLVVVS